jgi:hypothetical protein
MPRLQSSETVRAHENFNGKGRQERQERQER